MNTQESRARVPVPIKEYCGPLSINNNYRAQCTALLVGLVCLRVPILLYVCCSGGGWLKCWTHDRKIMISILGPGDALCSWAEHFIPHCSNPLSWQKGVILRQTSVPFRLGTCTRWKSGNLPLCVSMTREGNFTYFTFLYRCSLLMNKYYRVQGIDSLDFRSLGTQFWPFVCWNLLSVSIHYRTQCIDF